MALIQSLLSHQRSIAIDDSEVDTLQGHRLPGMSAVALVALLLWASSFGCSNKNAQPVIRNAAVPVVVAPAVQKTVPLQMRVIGTVDAYATVSIRSQINGELTEVHFVEGQNVRKGDLLFTLDRRPYEAARKQAEANLAKDVAQSSNAQQQAERYAKLLQEGVVPRERSDQFQTNVETFAAAIEADKAALEKAKVDLSYCTIRAPIDGRTGSLLVHRGNVVKANDLPLVTINQLSPLYVNFSVPEQNLQEIKRQMTLGKLSVEAKSEGEDRPEVGVLTFVDNAVDRTTGTIRLKGTFNNVERRLWPGQFVNVVLTLSSQPNLIVVPAQAIQSGQAGQTVWIVKPDMTAETRVVQVGRSVDGETVVEKGLQPGENVVIDGQMRLLPGARVEFKNTLADREGKQS